MEVERFHGSQRVRAFNIVGSVAGEESPGTTEVSPHAKRRTFGSSTTLLDGIAWGKAQVVVKARIWVGEKGTRARASGRDSSWF